MCVCVCVCGGGGFGFVWRQSSAKSICSGCSASNPSDLSFAAFCVHNCEKRRKRECQCVTVRDCGFVGYAVLQSLCFNTLQFS